MPNSLSQISSATLGFARGAGPPWVAKVRVVQEHRKRRHQIGEDKFEPPRRSLASQSCSYNVEVHLVLFVFCRRLRRVADGCLVVRPRLRRLAGLVAGHVRSRLTHVGRLEVM